MCADQMKKRYYHGNTIFNAITSFTENFEVKRLRSRIQILSNFESHNENLFLHNFIRLTTATGHDQLPKGLASKAVIIQLQSHSDSCYRLLLYYI